MKRLFLIVALQQLCAACGQTPAPACRVGADCASGVCRVDGTCAPMPDAGTGGGAAGGGAGGSGGTGGAGGSGGGAAGGSGGGTGGGMAGGMGGSGGGMAPLCTPNNDGTVTRLEMPLGAGLHATFRVATNATFNTAGSNADGGYRWDFTTALSGDKAVLVETQPLAGKWFENKFAGATYAAPLSSTDTLLGVFEVTNDALLLRGVVSPTDALTATELTYSPPAKLLSFPLSSATTWTTTSTVSGRLNGGFWTQSEKYDSTVDRVGEAATPFASFAPALRVKTVLTRTVGLVPTITRSYLFVTECFGTVATITSNAGESSAEFSSAAEVRRLAP